MGFSDYVHLDVQQIKRETDKAFLCRLEDGSERWIPKSVVSDAEDYSEGDVDCTISVQEWFATKEGIGT